MYLTGRPLEIVSGRAGLPLDTVRKHRSEWFRRGYMLPPLDESDTSLFSKAMNYVGSVITATHNPCGGCKDKPCEGCGKKKPARHPMAKHVLRFAVGITTAPRPVPTVAECTASVIAAGFSAIIFAEPGTNGLPNGQRIVHRPHRLGCWGNYIQTLRDLLAMQPDAQAVVIFQDDILIAPDTREFLEHDLWPSDKCGAVSLYSPDFPGYERGTKAGFNRQPGKYLMGACAMVYPRHVAEALVTKHASWRGVAKGKPVTDPTKKKATDTWIGHAIKGEGLHLYVPNPSLCQHIAETSSIGHGGASQLRKGMEYRRSKKYDGKSAFDSFEPSQVRFSSDGTMRLRSPLSVVIPAWNCFDLTENCLTALARNAGVGPLDVIYVDNGSETGVVDQVKALAKTLGLPLRTIEFPENRGFCPAANAGMQAAGGNHVLLLNNDACVHRGCIPAMLRHMLGHPRIASVGPLTGDGGSQSVVVHEDLAKLKGKNHTITRSMLVGFCQLKRAEALADVGLLDKNLPHGLGTDDDWAHRARAKGWRLLLACNAYCDHDHKSTFRRSGQDRRAMQVSAIEYLKQKGTWK